MLRKLLVRLLLGWKKEFFDVVEINGCHYIMDIHMYEPADKFIARAEKALQEQGSAAEDAGVGGER